MDEVGSSEGVSTPSRMSMAALCSPSQSPRPSSSSAVPSANANGFKSHSPLTNGHASAPPAAVAAATTTTTGMSDAEDVEMADSSQSMRINPSRKAKSAAVDRSAEEIAQAGTKNEDDDDDEEEDGNFGQNAEGEHVEDEDEDDDRETDTEEEDEEDDEDDEDEDEEDDEEEEAEEADGSERMAVEEAATASDGAEVERQLLTGAGSNDNKKVGMQSTAGPSNIDGQPNETDPSTAEAKGDASQSAATSKTTTKPAKKKMLKRRSPSVEPMPTGPPPRPSVRLRFSFCKREEDPYMTNVPDEIFTVLEKKDDPWAQWYQSTVQVDAATNGTADDADADADVEGSTDSEMALHSDLGGLARLLQKYPTQEMSSGKKAKSAVKGKAGKGKKSDMEYEIGEYDTRDPFVDDSELNVDEPTFSAKPSADGFFVVEGEIELQEAERNKIANEQETLASAAGKRGQMPPDFGQMEGDAGGAGAVYLDLGPTASSVAVVNTMLSRYANRFGIWPNKEDEVQDAPHSPVKANGSKSNGHTGTPSQSRAAREGSRDSPIKIDGSSSEDEASERPMPPFEPIQAVKYPVHRVPRRLEDEFIKLRQMAAKESWLKKSKFPPGLRDPLVNACRVAIALNQFNDNFFNWLPQIFPYNRHTLNKYVRRQVYNDHTQYMKQLMALNEEGFKRQIDEIYPRFKKEYKDALVAWEARGSRDGTPAEPSTAAGTSLGAGLAEKNEGDEGGAAGEGSTAAAGGEEEEGPVNKNAEPTKRWHWTELFRETLFTIITIDNAITELKQEKNQFENVHEKISTINQRKDIYRRLIELWPEKGWTTTTALSNQHGLYKRKVEKFAQLMHEGISSATGGVQGVVIG